MKKNLSFVVALVVVALLSACKTTAPTLGWKPTVVETDATASIRAAERQRDNAVRSANQSLAGVQAEAEIGLIQRSAVKPFEAPSKKEQPREILPVTEEPVAKPERVKPEKVYLKESTYETSARAIGLRGAYNFDISYQHYVGDNFVEISAGFLGWGGIHVSAVHNWIIGVYDWTPKGEWAWYAGVGANVGYLWSGWNGGSATIGVAGQIGLEYEFWFPLQISIDYRPTIGIDMSQYGIGFDYSPSALADAAISIRYLF